MRYIPLTDYPPPQKWIEKADNITTQLIRAITKKEAHAIIDQHERVWGEIKDHLLSISHGKCWYSEAKESFSHYHVDHFRPKKRAIDCNGNDCGGYYWLAFNWKNYRICGSVGNTKKGDRFQVRSGKAAKHTDPLDDELFYFLDPVDENDPPLLTFDETGTIKPSEQNSKTWNYMRASYTIENLCLNYEALKENRRALWNEISLKINEIINLKIEFNESPSASRRTALNEKAKQLKEYISPDKEFSAMASACLKKYRLI